MRKPRSYEEIALVVPTTIPYRRRSDRGAVFHIGKAIASLLEQAGLKKRDVDGVALSSFTFSPDTAVSLASYFALTLRWAEHIPFGGASGLVALQRAARAVQCGDAEIVACIGGDTNNEHSFSDIVTNFSGFSTDAINPYGGGGPNAVFGLITRRYMEQYGAKRSDFAKICVAQRENALAAGRSMFPNPLTVDECLQARPVAKPLHLFDCVMPCAGAEAFLVMTVDRAEALRLPYCLLRSSAELHNAYQGDDVHRRGGWSRFRDDLYGDAGIGPSSIDFVQTYDDYPVMAMIQLEGLGFCEEGSAPGLIREKSLTWNGGDLPHNTCGGQLSAGQAGAAGGFLGLVEAIRQLTSADLPNQVTNASVAVVSGYGMVIYERGICSNAVILQRA